MCGSGLGGGVRYWMCTLTHMLMGKNFPWGTLGVNIIGSFLIGIASAFLLGKFASMELWVRYFLIAGFLGGFTTFSAFSLETMLLFESGMMLRGLSNIALNIFACLIAVSAGYALGKQLY